MSLPQKRSSLELRFASSRTDFCMTTTILCVCHCVILYVWFTVNRLIDSSRVSLLLVDVGRNDCSSECSGGIVPHCLPALDLTYQLSTAAYSECRRLLSSLRYFNTALFYRSRVFKMGSALWRGSGLGSSAKLSPSLAARAK